ncbi:MAG: HIT domain-containing protein [Candidatus Pacebacteria bacterium]|nr:HIT domain-containing protein [Candidatus Paceibacterota bacterium]
MNSSRSILFVCTGNVFRSLSAEQSFKKYLSDNEISGWTVGSAGTLAVPQEIDPKVRATLSEVGINDVRHEQRRLTKDLLDQYDIVIGMAEDHIDFMRSEFNYKYGILFNDLAIGEKTSVRDMDEVPDYATNRPAAEAKIERTVQDIVGKTPAVFKNASERFYLFENLASGKTTHRNGYPFIMLHETPHSAAFMSIDIPGNEDGHVLVIPKKRYPDLAMIPDETLGDMLVSIKKVGDAISVDHGGYNVLLNNGLDAGQYIIHTHFHIIPRREGDGITIEGWQRSEISRDDFIQLNEKLKRKIQEVK